MFHLFQPDHIMNCQDFQRKIVPAGALSAQTNSGKCTWKKQQSKYSKKLSLDHKGPTGDTDDSITEVGLNTN